MSNLRNPYKRALAASMDLTAACMPIATKLGTPECPVPETCDVDLVAAYRHQAAGVLLLSRRINRQIERGFPRGKAA